MSGELVALNQNWLDATTAGASDYGTSSYMPCTPVYYVQPYVQPQTWFYSTTEHRPIKLTFSEVERLRAAAKRDAKLKKILAKFTDQIELIVDFE